jgi:hypothetical protein
VKRGGNRAGRAVPEPWESALCRAGFVRDRSGAYRLGSGPSLHPAAPTWMWQRLSSSDLPASGPWSDALFGESAQPEGPFKLVRGSSPGSIRFAADLPLRLEEDCAVETMGIDPVSGAGTDGPDGGGAACPSIWAADLAREFSRSAGRGPAGPVCSGTAGPFPAGTVPGGCTGEGPPGTVPRIRVPPAVVLARRWGSAPGVGSRPVPVAAASVPPPSTIAAWLVARSWDAAVEGDGVGVAFQAGRRRFGKVRIAPAGRGVRLAMNLAEVRDWSAVSLDALAEVACRANEALRLVRLAWRDEGGRRTVSAQVHLGRLPVLSECLELSLDALRAASAFLAVEVEALESAQLADLVILGARACGRIPAPPSGSAGAR